MSFKRLSLLLLCLALSGMALLATGCSGGGAKASDVDVDLTKMSSTMVYSEVFAMLYSPEDYVGKTVRMEGIAAAYHDGINDKDYYNCIVEDATACCSQGIEFCLADESQEYPPDGKEIVVQGTFNTYTEGKYEFIAIQEAQLL